MSSWKTYSVILEQVQQAEVTVKARSEGEAMLKAEERADDTLFENFIGCEAVYVREQG